MATPFETKFFEVRDRCTCMPAMAMKVTHKGKTPKEVWLLESAGYASDDESKPCILLVFLEINQCHFDPYKWEDRTKQVSHHYIDENFDTLESGGIIDVQFILGETKEPKTSDMYYNF